MSNPAAAQRLASIATFNEAQRTAFALFTEVARLPGLPSLYKAQAEAIAGLAKLKLTRVIGDSGPSDMFGLKEDVEALAQLADLLLKALGEEAAAGSQDVKLNLFDGQFFEAVDGGATYTLEHAAEMMIEDREATAGDYAYDFARV